MAVIAISTKDPGVARIFFDLRPAEMSRDAQRRIATAIERAVAEAIPEPDADFRLN